MFIIAKFQASLLCVFTVFYIFFMNFALLFDLGAGKRLRCEHTRLPKADVKLFLPGEGIFSRCHIYKILRNRFGYFRKNHMRL